MKKTAQNKKGFTLIEILTVLAIIGVLSAVVLVSMSSYGPKARSAKVHSMASSAIPAMISCWGNTDNSGNPAKVSDPTKVVNICNLGASYGAWPVFSGDLSNYSYVATDVNIDNAVGKRSSQWAFSVESISSSDNKKICCNSTMNGCKISAAGTTCTYNNPAN